MQTTDVHPDESAVAARNTAPTPLTQQGRKPAAPGTPAAPESAQLTLDPEVDGLINDLVEAIGKCAAYALGWRIRIGIHLHEFRDDLGPKAWRQLLQSGRLPFSPRTALSFARIGKHKVLANMQHVQKLPHATSVLSVIAALPPVVLEKALAEGTLNPRMSLEEAKRFVADHCDLSLALDVPEQP